MKTPVWALAAVLLALLVPFGAGLPMGASLNASSFEFHDSMTESPPPPTKVVRRADPTTTTTQTPTTSAPLNDPVWPFDPPGDPWTLPPGYDSDPYLYHCNKYTKEYNQIPPSGLEVKYTGPLVGDQQPAQGQTYTQAEIYQTFRWAASLLYSSHHGIIDLATWQASYGGVSFPRPFNDRQLNLDRAFIGLGSWTPVRGRGRQGGNTAIYEYPLVGGGVWPLAIPAGPSGPDRVLFQLMNGTPVYLGVITTRGVQPVPANWRSPASWGSIRQVNGRGNVQARESLRYPGLDPNANPRPDEKQFVKVKKHLEYLKNKQGYWGSVYGDNPPPPEAGPGAGAGGGGGGGGPYLPDRGPGGVGSSGGGAAGNAGALAGYGSMPMAWNMFLKNQPGFLAGPSHVEL
ncbi:hypothetical protein PG996_003288 [Apiospora saccharicola]|uniref:Uncharacterized protein n=1 Tax=Apiospora saccharicola TaxID=335842 RepID=A0ABR1W4P7_9PEZI